MGERTGGLVGLTLTSGADTLNVGFPVVGNTGGIFLRLLVSINTSPPSVSRSHSWQFSVRINITMHVAPAAFGANSTTLAPFSSALSHDCASGALLPGGTDCNSV